MQIGMSWWWRSSVARLPSPVARYLKRLAGSTFAFIGFTASQKIPMFSNPSVDRTSNGHHTGQKHQHTGWPQQGQQQKRLSHRCGSTVGCDSVGGDQMYFLLSIIRQDVGKALMHALAVQIKQCNMMFCIKRSNRLRLTAANGT